MKSILVPVDFSKATDLVLQATVTMAKALDARVTMMNVAPREANLIIMGSHGRGALYRSIVGSVSEGVMREAKCPVLIIPSKALKED